MRKICFLLLLILLFSCGRHAGNNSNGRIISVSIAPFKYFVTAIAGEDFNVNVMVPPGSDPHVYEPFPDQIRKLSMSEAYISNGYLGFEMAWLDRFYESNKSMKKLDLSQGIEPLAAEEHHEGGHREGADPHYWVSPKAALTMSLSVLNLLIDLNPSETEKYKENYELLVARIRTLDEKARDLFSDVQGREFMIYHPNLAYLARDYGLQEISVEFDGKEPPPSRMRELIDLARKEKIRKIFLQQEYDQRNARAIANEINADLVIINPLSEDWFKATSE